MSADRAHDLSGQWSGIFNYPALYPPNQFEATISDVAGRITGVITQPREFFEEAGPPQQAVIDGSHEGTSLTLVKIYDDLDRPTPHYRGTVQPGGDEIEGEWTIPGDWSGTFLMIRGARAAQAEERKLSETI